MAAAITTVHFMIIFVLFEVSLSQSTPDPPPPPRKRIPGGRSGGAKWVWCINKAKWEVGNPQNCKGVTDKAAFDAICAADWTDNFEGEGLWTWDPTANPPATYCKKLPSCFCELCSNKVSGGKSHEIKFDGDWGTWGKWEHCPKGSYVYGYKMKSEKKQKEIRPDGDDTAMNGIQLWCYKGDGSGSVNDYLKSSEGPWGDWFSSKKCPTGKPITGFQVQYQKQQGKGDDTALNKVRMYCGNTNENNFIEGSTHTDFGTWRDIVSCKPGFAVTGLATRVEARQGSGDDTAMNGLAVMCTYYG